jgi:hypothetical protein
VAHLGIRDEDETIADELVCAFTIGLFELAEPHCEALDELHTWLELFVRVILVLRQGLKNVLLRKKTILLPPHDSRQNPLCKCILPPS